MTQPILASEVVPLWPLTAYVAGVLALAGGILGLSYVLGERGRSARQGEPYECGIVPTGPARLRLPVRYYRVALFFVIFDLETAFIIGWAVAWQKLGWSGYVAVAIFIGVLLAALAYLWRQGALDWDRRPLPPGGLP